MRLGALSTTFTGTLLLTAVGCSSPSSPPTPPVVLVDQTCSPRACHADVAMGIAALERGDFGAAATAFECGDTREASFGAGLTTLIAALEGPSATQVLADVGLPSLSAKDIVGSTGIFSRYAAQWRGNGMIEMSDGQGVVRSLAFEQGKQLTGSGTYVRMRSITALTSLGLQFGNMPLGVGATIQLGCQSTGGFAPYLSLTTEEAFCSTPNVCSTDAGSITIGAAGVSAGERSEYALHRVNVTCTPKTAAGPAVPYFLDGTLTTILSNQVDVSDLHPLFSDEEPFGSVPSTTTLGQVATDAQGLRGSLDVAACYFKAAGGGPAGRIFEIPATMFGATPIPVTTADAKLLGGASETAAGALELLTAYDLPMLLSGMLCGGAIGCLSDEAATERFNGGIGRLVSTEPIAHALNRFVDASAVGAQALTELSAESVVLRTPYTAASLDRARDYLQWAHDSLTGQNPDIPHVTPPLKIDLASPFANPPDPSKIPYKPLAYNATSRQVEIVDAFVRAAVPAWNHLQWTNAFWDQYNVESLPPSDRTDLIGRRLEGYGLTGN